LFGQGNGEIICSIFGFHAGRALLRGHIAKLASLTEEEFAHFFSHFKPHSYKKGQVVIKEGDKVEMEYFVVSGCLKAFYINDDVKMQYPAVRHAHLVDLGLPGLVCGTRATIAWTGITDVELLSLSNSDREKVCDQVHQAERFFRLRTNKGYVAAQRRLLSFMNNRCEGPL